MSILWRKVLLLQLFFVGSAAVAPSSPRSNSHLNGDITSINPHLMRKEQADPHVKPNSFLHKKEALRTLIPENLIFTHKQDLLQTHGASLVELHDDKGRSLRELQKNVLNTVAVNSYNGTKDVKVMFFTDEMCLSALRNPSVGQHFLATMFEMETTGAYKADICRVAALYLHGGQYFDTDLLVRYPKDDILGGDPVGFAVPTAYSFSPKDSKSFFQAYVASAPRHPLLKLAFEEMQKWYSVRQYKLCSATDGSSSFERSRSRLQFLFSAMSRFLFSAPSSFCSQLWANSFSKDGVEPEPEGWMGTVTMRKAYDRYQSSEFLSEFGRVRLFKEAKIEDNQMPSLYEAVERQHGKGLCDYIVYDPLSKKVLFYSRIVGATGPASSSCSRASLL